MPDCYLDMISRLKDGDGSLPRSFSDSRKIHRCVVFSAILTTSETGDFVECRVDIVKLNSGEAEILLDEAILELVVLGEVYLIPPCDRFLPINFDNFLVVEKLLRRA